MSRPNMLNLVQAQQNDAGLTRLVLGGTEVHSIAELRANFALEPVAAALANGTLAQWLEERYYDHEAAEIKKLGQELSPAVEQELCRILGVDYLKYCHLSPEQREAYEKKCALIRQHTDDAGLLAHALETATNQSELAELLNAGKTTIYLCADRFTVPIRKSGIHYIGIGDPEMEVPFTEEQYRRAGITFEKISLPQKADAQAEVLAKEAARSAGYDDYADTHSTLSSIVHRALKKERLTRWYYLEHNAADVAAEFYRSKTTAEQAAQRTIEDAYEKANAFFIPGSGHCIADTFSERYGNLIQKKMETILERLMDACAENTALYEKVAVLDQLSLTARQVLQTRFEKELRENTQYYFMYKKSYFLDRIEITDHDFNVDLFESDLLNGLARLIHDETEYTVDGILETIGEMQDDINSHAEMFFSAAYDVYRDYCLEIEEIAEEIGKDLSDDDLIRMGILEEKESVG